MRIALTGGVGSGKSTVSRIFAQRGAVIIDADAIAREVVQPGEPALDDIVQEFGLGVIRSDGTLDRSGLAEIAFGDPEALERLNAITHPRIAKRAAELLAAAPADAVVVYDMPLLVEQGPQALQGWDAIVVVDCPEQLRVERLVARGMDPEDARRRIAAQASREDRLAVADHIIDNSGDLETLQAQVESLWSGSTGPGA